MTSLRHVTSLESSFKFVTRGGKLPYQFYPNLGQIPINRRLTDALAYGTDAGVQALHWSTFRAVEGRSRVQPSPRGAYYLLRWNHVRGPIVTISDIEWWLKRHAIGIAKPGQLEVTSPQELVALAEWHIFEDCERTKEIASWLPIRALGGNFRSVGSPSNPNRPRATMPRCYFELRQQELRRKTVFGGGMTDFELHASFTDVVNHQGGTILVRACEPLGS